MKGDLSILFDGLPEREPCQMRVLILDMNTDPFTNDLDGKRPLVDRLVIVEPEPQHGKGR